MSKQIVQFVTKQASKKKSPYGDATTSKKKTVAAFAAVPVQEEMAVFDPPAEFAGRDAAPQGIKAKVLNNIKAKLQAIQAPQEPQGIKIQAPVDLNPRFAVEAEGSFDNFYKQHSIKYSDAKKPKSKSKSCICGRSRSSCSPVLYYCCKCNKQFCSSYVGRGRNGLVHTVNNNGECGPLIHIRKNSISQIKIKTS